MSRGFSLIELLITLALLAVLAGSAMSFADLAIRRADEQELRLALRQIRDAIDAYKQAADAGRLRKAADESGYPRTLAELSNGVADAANANSARIYFLRRLPRDPMADPQLSAEQSWGQRSYASEPDDPRPGRDVFDVFSLSQRQGLNGQPYRQW